MEDMPLKGKKIAIMVEQDYQDLELWYPLLRFQEAGAEVITVGTGRMKEYKGKFGYPAKEHITADQAMKMNFDAVVVPGGWAPDFMRRYPEPAKFVKKMYEHKKIVAAICHGPWLLASAGILKSRKLTGFMAVKDDIVNAGGDFVDEEVVVDGKLVTSRKPEDLPAFCRAVIKLLS